MLSENQPIAAAWLKISTQWQVGISGRTGLRYESVLAWLDRFGEKVGIDDVEKAFELLQVMENAALEADAERREEANQERAGGD